MLDINRHKFFMLQILKDIYSNPLLAVNLGFKGGTACMFFHNLPRFSVDLDFNLINADYEDQVYDAVRTILLKYGKIHDEAKKFYGPILVLDYGAGDRKLKVEISKRDFGDKYIIANLLGLNIKLMAKENMFAHKLCAMLDRNEITNRDISDCWFYMENRTPINRKVVEQRMGKSLEAYLQDCIDRLNSMSDRGMLNGLGELMDEDMKKFVKTKLRKETIQLLEFYKLCPIETSEE